MYIYHTHKCMIYLTKLLYIYITIFSSKTSIFSKQDRYPRSTYERLFRKEYGYNNKLHRDDREHAKSRGLVVNKEVHINYTHICVCC